MTEDQWNSRFDLWAIRPFDGAWTLGVKRKVFLFSAAYLAEFLTRHPCPACQEFLGVFDDPGNVPTPEWWTRLNLAWTSSGHAGTTTAECRTRRIFLWTRNAAQGISTFREFWFVLVWRTGGFADHNEFFRFAGLDVEGRRQVFLTRDIDLDSWEYGMNLVREIFPSPFQSVERDPRWLPANVVELASKIDAERAFCRLCELADRLTEAGCDQRELLAHLRSDGPHVRGCWALDRILGQG